MQVDKACEPTLSVGVMQKPEEGKDECQLQVGARWCNGTIGHHADGCGTSS